MVLRKVGQLGQEGQIVVSIFLCVGVKVVDG